MVCLLFCLCVCQSLSCIVFWLTCILFSWLDELGKGIRPWCVWSIRPCCLAWRSHTYKFLFVCNEVKPIYGMLLVCKNVSTPNTDMPMHMYGSQAARPKPPQSLLFSSGIASQAGIMVPYLLAPAYKSLLALCGNWQGVLLTGWFGCAIWRSAGSSS
jgi:hypothetical protein